MHEISLLYKILECVRAAAEENHVRRVKFIELELGELSGILPAFLEQYFKPVAETDPLFTGAELNIKSIPGAGLCAECGSSYPIEDLGLPCPTCGSRNVRIMSGREIAVRNILVETDGGEEDHA